MSKRQITYSDLTGGINNVDTKETLNSSPRKTETPDMVNVEYFGLGGIQTMKGNTQVGNTQTNPVVGGHEYTKGNKRYMMIATLNGEVKIYNEATNSYTTIFKFENKSDKVSFCNMNNGVVVSNGIDDLLFYEFGRNTELFGNVSFDEYSHNTLIGTETKFGTDVKVGDYITIDNINGKYKVEDIQNETTMTVTPDLDVKDGVEYYGFVGDKITVSKTSPNNMSVTIGNFVIDDEYDNIKNVYTYNHNGNNEYNITPSYVSISGEIKSLKDLDFEAKNGATNITTTGYYIFENSLYKSGNIVDNSGVWTDLSSGYCNVSGRNKDLTQITYGIKDNILYSITESVDDRGSNISVIKQIGTGFTKLPNECGNYISNVCPVFNNNGGLYIIKTTLNESTNVYTSTVTRVGTGTGWYKQTSIVNQISTWCGSVSGYSGRVTSTRTYCLIISANGNAYSYYGSENPTMEVSKSTEWIEALGCTTTLYGDVFGDGTPIWFDTNITTALLQRKTNNMYTMYSCNKYNALKINEKVFPSSSYKIYATFRNDIYVDWFQNQKANIYCLSTKVSNNTILMKILEQRFVALVESEDDFYIPYSKEILGTTNIDNILLDSSLELSGVSGTTNYFIVDLYYNYNYTFNNQSCILTSTGNSYFTLESQSNSNTNVNTYPYFTKVSYSNSTEIKTSTVRYDDTTNGFINEGLIVNGIATIGDIITIEYNITDKNVIRYTTDLVNANDVYINANNTSSINNIESINNYSDGTNIILIYNIQISENVEEQFIGTYNSNDNIINKDELLDTTNLQYYLSDVSELNAYLVNTDPDISSDENIHTPIRGTAIQYYNGRLWVGTDNGLFYSAVGLPNNWDIYSDAGVLYSIYNDSSKISALGIFSEYITVHKQFSTYILTCTGDSSTIEVKPFSNITCESQQGWIVSNTKYFVFSKDFLDIYPLIQHTVWSDKFLGVPISQKIRNFFKKVRIGDTDKIFCVSRPRERQMLFYLPIEGFIGSNVAVIYDFQTNSWLMRQVPQNVTCAFQYNNKIYIGTDTGKVLEEFRGNTFDGVPIESYYKSPWFDWAGSYTQSFAEFILEIDNEEDNNFFIDTQKDGQSRKETRNINSDKLYGKSMLWAYPTTTKTIEKIKVNNNYEIVGNVDISDDGIASGFGKHDYIKLPITDLGDNFEIMIAFNTGNIFSKNRYLLNFKNVIKIETSNSISNYHPDGYLAMEITSHWHGTGATTQSNYFGSLERNKDYYIKLKYKNKTLSCTISTDGVNFVKYYADISYTQGINNGSSNITLGCNESPYGENFINPFDGTIDLKKSYIKSGDSIVWRGITEEIIEEEIQVEDKRNTEAMEWDNNNWLRATFETIRMLLPNNVFEDFQLKFFTNKIGQLFKIFKYGFRRIEADEEPW